ncbi:MAG: hypothetical protein ACI9HY_002117, partial [Planctomycetaceae bacterium]
CIKYRRKVGEPPQFWQTDWREKFWRMVSILTVREKGGLFYLYFDNDRHSLQVCVNNNSDSHD